jgi:hypothetical protein
MDETQHDDKEDLIATIRGNPILYLDLKTQEAVILQQSVVSAVCSRNSSAQFTLTKADKDELSDAREVLADERGRYLRMPGIRMPKARQWMRDFIDTFGDRKLRHRLQTYARQSRSLQAFTEALQAEPLLFEEWLEFRSQKLMQEFLIWASTLPIFPNYGYSTFE